MVHRKTITKKKKETEVHSDEHYNYKWSSQVIKSLWMLIGGLFWLRHAIQIAAALIADEAQIIGNKKGKSNKFKGTKMAKITNPI